jgi:hypothetical protein
MPDGTPRAIVDSAATAGGQAVQVRRSNFVFCPFTFVLLGVVLSITIWGTGYRLYRTINQIPKTLGTKFWVQERHDGAAALDVGVSPQRHASPPAIGPSFKPVRFVSVLSDAPRVRVERRAPFCRSAIPLRSPPSLLTV